MSVSRHVLNIRPCALNRDEYAGSNHAIDGFNVTVPFLIRIIHPGSSAVWCSFHTPLMSGDASCAVPQAVDVVLLGELAALGLWISVPPYPSYV